jgi:hypothetical protein
MVSRSSAPLVIINPTFFRNVVEKSKGLIEGKLKGRIDNIDCSFVERTLNEMVGRRVACLDDIQYWHIDNIDCCFVERILNEFVEGRLVVNCILTAVLICGQVACLEDIQYRHIEFIHDFHLLLVEILYPGIAAIRQSLDAACILLTFPYI